MFDHAVAIWDVCDLGPLINSGTVFGIPTGDDALVAQPVSPVTITNNNSVVNGTAGGYAHFITCSMRDCVGRLAYSKRDKFIRPVSR